MLEKARKLQPLPCPPDQDFSRLDFPALRSIACRADRLKRNWSQAEPKHKAHVEIHTGFAQFPMAFVPGYPILITWAVPGQVLQCWNVKTKSCLGIIEGVHSERLPPRISRPFIQEGQFTIAVVSCRGPVLDRSALSLLFFSLKLEKHSSSEIVIAYVDYSTERAITFRERFRRSLVSETSVTGTVYPRRVQLTLCSPSAGFIVYNGSSTACAAFGPEQKKMKLHLVSSFPSFDNELSIVSWAVAKTRC